MALAPCPGCARHLDVRELECPFCGAPTPLLRPRVGRAGKSVTRAAIAYFGVVLATGCGPDAPEPPPPEPIVVPVAAPYGAPPRPPEDEPPPETDAPEADAPEADAPEADAPEADAPEPEAGRREGGGRRPRDSIAQPYGAPPSPDDSELDRVFDDL